MSPKRIFFLVFGPVPLYAPERAEIAHRDAELLHLASAILDVEGTAFLIAHRFEFRQRFLEIHVRDFAEAQLRRQAV